MRISATFVLAAFPAHSPAQPWYLRLLSSPSPDDPRNVSLTVIIICVYALRIMAVADYKRALQAAQRELQESVTKRDLLNLRIVQLQQTIRGLSVRCALEERNQAVHRAESCAPSITEMIRAILRMNRRAMTTAEVRDALWASGFDLGQYSNPLGLVGTALERMAATEDVIKLPGRPASYQWFEWGG